MRRAAIGRDGKAVDDRLGVVQIIDCRVAIIQRVGPITGRIDIVGAKACRSACDRVEHLIDIIHVHVVQITRGNGRHVFDDGADNIAGNSGRIVNTLDCYRDRRDVVKVDGGDVEGICQRVANVQRLDSATAIKQRIAPNPGTVDCKITVGRRKIAPIDGDVRAVYIRILNCTTDRVRDIVFKDGRREITANSTGIILALNGDGNRLFRAILGLDSEAVGRIVPDVQAIYR